MAPGVPLRGFLLLLVLLLLLLLLIFAFLLLVGLILVFFSAFVTHGVTPFVWQNPFRDLCGTNWAQIKLFQLL